MHNIRKLILVSFSVACIIAIVVCIIVNVAMDKQITWSAYPILSVPFGWLVFSPLLIKKHGILFSILSLMLFTLPFLFLLEKITPVGNWFAPLGIPSAAVGIITIWAIYFLFRFFRINLWYKSAVTVFLVGVIANPIINYYVNMFLYSEQKLISTIISAVSCLILSVIIGIRGYKSNKAKSAYIQATH
jgi:hypothetical protein